MLDIKFIRENPEKVKEAMRNRNVDFDVDALLAIDEKRRAMIKETDDLRSRQNEFADEISHASGAERQGKIEESKKIKMQLAGADEELKTVGEEFMRLMREIPNIPSRDVPVGKGERDNVVHREVGKKPEFGFESKDHAELGEALGIIDFERGAKVAGSGFYYLKNAGALLELALVHYAFDFLQKKGFTLCTTPDMARRQFYLGTGYLPRGPEAQTYEIAESDLGLIATSEVTLAALHADEIMEEEVFPVLYAGYSHCFRQESGAYGKYSRGLYRVHQFTKVEMFAYARPDESERIHEDLLRFEEELWQGLDVPYRVLEMCTADLGAQAARKYDLEAWMPGRGDWGEITSTSNTTDYQARNLNIRYRKKGGHTEFVHMLNGTAVATSRAIVAILENYQQEDGSVRVPEVLQKYMGGLKVIQRL